MIINQNLAAMNSRRILFESQKALNSLSQKIASGNRISSPGDDPSGLAIGEKLFAQNAGLMTALQNAQDGQALLRIADGGLSQTGNILARMQELAVRGVNGTLTDSDRAMLMDEFNALRDQIGQVAGTTEYNTQKVLSGALAVQASLSGDGADGMTLQGAPASPKSGEATVEITATARAATVAGSGAAARLSQDGSITVNGTQVNLTAGMSLGEVAAAINAENDSTGVVATLNAAGTDLVLTSGIIDQDAQNALDRDDARRDDVKGYALQGSRYSVTLDGGELLGELGLSAGKVEGSDVEGTLDGMRLTGSGTTLVNSLEGTLGYGARIEPDTVNGAAGAVILDKVDGNGSQVEHASAAGDQAVLRVEGNRALTLQTGANYDQNLRQGIGSFAPGMLGRGAGSRFSSLADVQIASVDDASLALKTIAQAIEDVNRQRSRIGASLNRLEQTVGTLAIQHENMSAAVSRIMDFNLLEGITRYTAEGIRSQLATAMNAQANTDASRVLALLQG